MDRSILWKAQALALALAGCVSAFADSIVIKSPSDKAFVSMMKPAQKLYTMLTAEQLDAVFSDKALANDLGKRVGSFPQGVSLRWAFQGARGRIHYEVTYADNPEFKDATTIKPPHSTCEIFNLELGKTYYWKASACYDDGTVLDSSVATFTVEPTTPRIMNVPGVDNFRDLGGRIGLEGRRLKQGMLFRSTGLNNNSADGGKTPGKARFTDEGKRILLEDLKIKTELDLRSHGETANMTSSPLGDSVKYINISSTCYGGCFTDSGRENYAKLFRIFCDPANYPINFHCIAGADRTGSLAYILEAVLGVAEHETRIDYTYTSFMAVRNTGNFNTLNEPMNSYGNANEPLYVKAERYLIHAGITPEEIQAFRDIMLGEGTKPSPDMVLIRDFTANQSTGALPIKARLLRTDIATARVCGKDFDLASFKYAPDSILAKDDGNGGCSFLLFSAKNALSLPLVLTTNAAAADYYTVTSPSHRLAFTFKGNVKWKASELEQFKISIPSGLFLLEVNPGKKADSSFAKVDGCQKNIFNVSKYAVGVPEIDGKLDDAVWKNAKFTYLSTSTGKDGGSRHCVAYAADADCNTLFVAAKFTGLEVPGNELPQDSLEIFNSNCIEVFISSTGGKDYYQFAFNSAASMFDGKGRSSDWNSKGCVAKTTKTDDGWIAEIAIPLAQLNLQGAVESNITYSEYSADGSVKLYSLWKTDNNFHNRNAMLPVNP